jgi:hypothetical protein
MSEKKVADFSKYMNPMYDLMDKANEDNEINEYINSALRVIAAICMTADNPDEAAARCSEIIKQALREMRVSKSKH